MLSYKYGNKYSTGPSEIPRELSVFTSLDLTGVADGATKHSLFFLDPDSGWKEAVIWPQSPPP